MRIGIFTITDALNYGAYFQMYAMYQYLVDLGYDVDVFDCNRSLKLKLIKNVSVNPKRHFFKRKVISSYRKDWDRISIKKYKGQELDLAIVGSDEIWNLDNQHFYHAPEYFGIGINAKYKIAYAPSVGFGDIKKIALDNCVATALTSFDFLFPRDTQTKSLIKECVDKEKMKNVIEVVDPTILYNSWESFKTSADCKKPQIVYYSYDKNPPFKDELLKFARERGLKIISAGFQTDWADENSSVGPFDFLKLISESEYVITTTFHGTIMSALLDCSFICIPNGQKATNLVEKFSLEKNVFGPDDILSDKFDAVSRLKSSHKFVDASKQFRILLSSAIEGLKIKEKLV
ncbi:polysaccharide pyruvyl transferase family protein [Ferrimonas balearica]|uniref:polysaccharide pyruvyl transferase family protein n=1 Tax=Ferrimonas balearica TaxID=44012 RepID=UPI001F238FF3|nr:polysaccharide pyruvyl transferase family protein [Ferrimonas balearica]MBY6018280.1 polysaccharide pyruvyl transferase family protein [Halomonas denitrificans]MBY6094620.1 polysaccharide pyruvyl transferase family protein [Ferrimonas balearica]